MHVILGATGHIGSALAKNLLRQGEKVTVIVRNEEKGRQWQQKGAQVAIADVLDTESLRQAFKKGKRLFLLNPPAPPGTDTVAEEKKTVASILDALKGLDIEKIVAESTYGTQTGDGIGDLGVLYELEQGLKALNVPHSIIRAAYYMSNWDLSLETAKKEGIVHTLYPVDFKLPMVAPEDLGDVAARLMTQPIETTGLHYVEGPKEYSAKDVAKAFSTVLQKQVKAVETPKDQWLQTLTTLGFSQKAAASMAAMTEITLAKKYERATPVRGTITLEDYITQLVQKARKQAPVPSTP